MRRCVPAELLALQFEHEVLRLPLTEEHTEVELARLRADGGRAPPMPARMESARRAEPRVSLGPPGAPALAPVVVGQLQRAEQGGVAVERLDAAQDDTSLVFAWVGERLAALDDVVFGDESASPDERAVLVVAPADEAPVGCEALARTR